MGKFREYLKESKEIKYVMCPNCNEQNDIHIDHKNKGQYACENCKQGFKGSYIEKGKMKGK